MRTALLPLCLLAAAAWAQAPDAPKRVVHGADAPTHRIADGKGTATLLMNASTGSPEVALSRLELAPGAKVPEHTHETGEWLYVLGGAADFVVDGQALVAKEGDAVFIPKGLKHQASVPADAKAPVVVVQVYAPAGAEQRFTKGPRVEKK